MRTNERGFSIGEVLMSMTVLLVGTLATVSLLSESIRTTQSNRDVIVASGLAQEGVELVRNIRDDELTDPSGAPAVEKGFDPFQSKVIAPKNHHCRFSYDDKIYASGAIKDVKNGACTNVQGTVGAYRLYRHNTTKRYSYDSVGAAATKFKRYLHLDFDDTTGKPPLDVVSYVFWGDALPTGSTTGDTTACTVANKCVFSRERLEAWVP